MSVIDQEVFNKKPKMVYIAPEEVLQDFLRNNLADPRGRYSTKTQSFSSGSTTYTLTPDPNSSFGAIEDVRVGGISQEKWKDYYIDTQNFQVIFFSTTASSVDIDFKQGENWIFQDKPRMDLDDKSFPRISIRATAGTGTRLGTYKSDIENSIEFQIDVWVKEHSGDRGNIFTIGNRKFANDKLAEKISWEVQNVFKNSINEVHPQLYAISVLGIPRLMGYERDTQTFHGVVEINLRSLNTGDNI